MTNDDCQSCGLASENERLRREVAGLQREVAGLRRAIRRAKQYALGVYREAAKVRGEHQPRGTWALWTGKGEVAREVYNRLGEE